MNPFKLDKAPIIEAVVDIDCDMPPTFTAEDAEETVAGGYKTDYPILKKKYEITHKVTHKQGEEPQVDAAPPKIQALQFLNEDKNQLVQVRNAGFSFNRLAPYKSLDTYLPEIQKTWVLFAEALTPIQVKRVCLRYINRFSIPLKDGSMQLNDYLKQAPILPDEKTMTVSGFVNQHLIKDQETGNHAKVVLATQHCDYSNLTLLLDIGVTGCNSGDIQWPFIDEELKALRDLKNRVFFNIITDKCKALFQQQ
jgi:uncharacterized protein (TIGR04255 family)